MVRCAAPTGMLLPALHDVAATVALVAAIEVMSVAMERTVTTALRPDSEMATATAIATHE